MAPGTTSIWQQLNEKFLKIRGETADEVQSGFIHAVCRRCRGKSKLTALQTDFFREKMQQQHQRRTSVLWL